jgi:hypothetical protein
MSKNLKKTTKKSTTSKTKQLETEQISTIENIHTKLQNFLELGCVPEQNSEMNSPNTLENMQNTMVDDKNNEPEVYDTAGKKRGRKPRGGKLIVKQPETSNSTAPVSNIILHLKCSTRDLNDYNTKLGRMMTDPLEYNPEVPPEVLTYNGSQQEFTTFDENMQNTTLEQNGALSTRSNLCKRCLSNNTMDNVSDVTQFDADDLNDTTNIKDINAKLKMLKIQLYKNAIQTDKNAACFWCTYDFDNSPCYIPKYEMDNTIYGYGSFCRPECAVAYLMKENIDDSTKFERYQLLNQIYSKVYGCKKNIKPAPNPYYLLDKYYGNLTIQEYRKLLKTEHLLLVIDKPLTRILPELHEDNEDMIMNIYGINKSTDAVSGVYKVKRQSEKQQGPSKASIIRNKFGLA